MVALLKRPGEYQGNQAQLEGQPTTGMPRFIPIVPDRPQPDFYTPAPGNVHYGMPVTEDLRNLASRYLHNPGSHVDKFRMRGRSGAIKALISLGIPNFSGPSQLGYGAPAILVRVLLPFPCIRVHHSSLYLLLLQEVSNHGPLSHVPLHHNAARPPPGSSSIGYSIHSGMSVTENLKDLASPYLHNPFSHVVKLRMKQSGSGVVKVFILLEIDDIM